MRWPPGGLLIFVLTFGTTLRQNWESAGLQLTYALVFSALLAFRECNALSVDGLLEKSGNNT
jgi:thiosulfate dehydrogenase (quinone) large subunit